jgi:hypothetical protein
MKTIRERERERRLKVIDALLHYIPTSPETAKTPEEIVEDMRSKGEPMAKHASGTWVLMQIERARDNGHLIVRNDKGYYQALTYEDFDAWRKAVAVPELTSRLDQLHAMGKTAKLRFGKGGEEEDRRVTG